MSLGEWASIYFHMVIEFWAVGPVFFAIVWFFMRKSRGQVLEIGIMWYAIGIIATIIGSGTIKFLAIFVLGGSAVMNPSQNLKTFFLSIAPIFTAFAVSIYIKSHAYNATGGNTERIQDDIGAGKYKKIKTLDIGTFAAI